MEKRWALLAAFAMVLAAPGMTELGVASEQEKAVRVERLLDAPIITPATHPSIGANIQGPSLIRVPEWVENPLGRYYLYFADHKGSYIRLAYADDLLGPWRIHAPGSLQIESTHFPAEPPPIPPGALEKAAAERAKSKGGNNKLPHSLAKELTATHIASPDAHVDHQNKRIVMYFHGLDGFNSQLTRVATSRDSIHFQGLPEKLGRSYFRVFQHAGMTYALVMPGRIYRSKDGLTSFEEGPVLFNPKMRHSALLKRGDLLYVFWTQVGDVPERILLSTIDLSVPWEQWSETAGVEVLRPEREWEGAKEPLKPSLRSVAYGPVNQLRDPAIYEEDGACFSAVCGGGRERYCDRGSAFRGGRRVARPRTPHVLRRGEETKAWTEAHGGGRDARTRKATCKSRQVEQELILK